VATVSLSQWLQDKRASSHNKNTWYDVDAIVKWDIWGAQNENTQEYYYGRWINPATGVWEPLGFVAWNYYQYGRLIDHQYLNYLVDCSASVPCSTCPP